MNDAEIKALQEQNEQFRTELSKKDSQCAALTAQLDETKQQLASSAQIAERLNAKQKAVESKLEATRRDLREVFTGMNQAMLTMLEKYQE